MSRDRIIVQCYAGARGNERPRRMIINGREHLVTRLIEESVEESAGTRVMTHRYKVLTRAGAVLEILHMGEFWYLEKKTTVALPIKFRKGSL